MLTSLIFVLALAAPNLDRKPNFTGVWKADDNRSIGRVPEEFEMIEQNESECKIQIQLRQLDISGPPASYIIDGKDKTIGQSTIRASWVGSTLVIDEETTLEGGASVSHYSLSLSDDGETLTKRSQSGRTGKIQESTTIFTRISSTAKMNHFEKGSTIQELEDAWGQPDEVVGTGLNLTFYYFNWLCGRSRVCRREVIFADGKISEIR